MPNSPGRVRARPPAAHSAWAELRAYSDVFTCYSAAVAAALAVTGPGWRDAIDPRLTLTLTDEPDGLFGFVHFAPDFGARARLVRAGTDSADEAVGRITAALGRGEPVVVAGDTRWLPWQVGHGGDPAPHWFTVVAHDEGVEVLDALAMRNTRGEQRPVRTVVDDLRGLLLSVPVHNPVIALRERYALGDDAGPITHRHRWLEIGERPAGPAPGGSRGPAALRTLARHFRDHATDPDAYRQVDDLWSVGRHRAFAVRRWTELADDCPAERDRVQRYGDDLRRLWAQVPPRAMYAATSGGAGAGVLSDLLDELADLESAAGCGEGVAT